MTTKTKRNVMRTEETYAVEALLMEAGFEKVDAYRYNSAVIRLRVVDPRFEGMSWKTGTRWSSLIWNDFPRGRRRTLSSCSVSHRPN